MPSPETQDRPSVDRSPRWPWLVLGAYLLGMVVVVGWPDGWAVNRLVVDLYYRFFFGWAPRSFGPDQLQVLLNVLICLPPVAASVALFRRTPWWVWVLLGLLLSVAVEVAQRFIGRLSDPMDVVANGTGALLGGLIGRYLRRRARVSEQAAIMQA